MTDFLYPFLDADERDAGRPAARPRRVGRGQGAESAALRESTLDANRALIATAAAEMARRFAAGGRLFTFGNGGSSTDAATLVALFARPPVGEPAPGAGRSSTTRRCSPRSATTSASSSCSPASSSPTPGRATSPSAMSTSGNSRNLLAGVRARPAPAACSPSGSPATTAARWRRRPMSTSASSCAADSVHRIQEAQAARGLRAVDRGAGATRAQDARRARHDRARLPRGARSSTASRRSAAAGRGCNDEVVTLAHGAGGKASAALVDAVFLEAFGNDAAADGAVLTAARRRAAGVHHRLVRRAAPALPRRLDRPPRRARHRERPRHGGRGAALAVGRVRDRGGLPDRRAAGDRRRHGRRRRGRGRRDRHRRHQGGGPGRGRRPVHHDRGRRRHPRRTASSAPACGPATSCWSRARSPTTAWR